MSFSFAPHIIRAQEEGDVHLIRSSCTSSREDPPFVAKHTLFAILWIHTQPCNA